MSAKFTPGEWALDWNVSRIDVFSADATTLVATIRRSPLSDGVDRAARANARLIAAAPELLEALCELADLMDAVRAGNYTPDSFTNQPARAAIAKATGEQQ